MDSPALRIALFAGALLTVWGTAAQALMLFHGEPPRLFQWVHFGVGTGYQVMSGCLVGLVLYGLALVSVRAARWAAWATVTAVLAFNYTDYVYFLLFLTHLPWSSLEYVGQLSNFASSIRAALLDLRFVALFLLPAGLATWGLLLRGEWVLGADPLWGAAAPLPPPRALGWKRHAAALGTLLAVGVPANTLSNSYLGKNPADPLQFTALQYFFRTRSQLQDAPAVLTAAALARLAPAEAGYPLLRERRFDGCLDPAPAFRELCARAGVGPEGRIHSADPGGRSGAMPPASHDTGRSAAERDALPPNLVFVMVESFRAQEIGVLGGRIAGPAPEAALGRSLTPRFDALAAQGILFRNFYANGFQTRDGLVASYCGLYPNLGRPILGTYNRVRERCLPELLEARGYHTLWVHGGDADFDGQRDFLLRNGFQRIVDRWDFPLDAPVQGWGVTDEALMDRTVQELRALPEPFFASVLTITNHHPFEVPAGAATHGSDEYGRFLDTMAYTDRALGRLLDKARAEAFSRRTIFFIYADHSVPQPAPGEVSTPGDDLAWRHRIPLLIVADGLRPQAVDAPGSQVDLPALAMDLVGGRAAVPWQGQSPVARLAPDATPPAMMMIPGRYLGLVGPRGAAERSPSGWSTQGTLPPPRLPWAEDLTLAARWALEHDRVVPGP